MQWHHSLVPRPNASQLRVDYITATLASDALGLGTRLRGHHRFQLRCMQSVKIFQKSLVYSMEFAREFLPISRLIKAKLYLTSSVTACQYMMVHAHCFVQQEGYGMQIILGLPRPDESYPTTAPLNVRKTSLSFDASEVIGFRCFPPYVPACPLPWCGHYCIAVQRILILSAVKGNSYQILQHR